MESVSRVLADGGVVIDEGASPAAINSPRRVEGEAFAHVSRIRVEGNIARIWVVMDNLRAAATIAVANAGALLRRE